MLYTDTSRVKEIHLNTLREIMRKQRWATKPQLAKLSGLSIVTVNALVKELCEKGELTEYAVQTAGIGRPALSYCFNSAHHLALVICAQERDGEDRVFISVNDLYGAYLYEAEYLLKEISEVFFDRIVEAAIEKFPAIHAIAFGLPGAEVDGELFYIGNMQRKSWRFTDHFAQKFGLPVLFENDMNAATAGYCLRSGVTDQQCVIGIFFPEKHAPGAGIYCNGRIHRGRDGVAGEVSLLSTRVDWHNFDYLQMPLAQVAADFVLPITLLYNADQVIFYGQWLPADLPDAVRRSLAQRIPPELLPAMEVVPDMHSDFKNGMVHLALRSFEPKAGT